MLHNVLFQLYNLIPWCPTSNISESFDTVNLTLFMLAVSFLGNHDFKFIALWETGFLYELKWRRVQMRSSAFITWMVLLGSSTCWNVGVRGLSKQWERASLKVDKWISFLFRLNLSWNSLVHFAADFWEAQLVCWTASTAAGTVETYSALIRLGV